MAKPQRRYRLNERHQALVVKNMALVPWFLQRYCRGWMKIRPNEMGDLEQELYIGLCRAAHDFDESKGSFSTFAIWWMRSRMTEWARRLPPLHIGTITDSVKMKEEKRDYEIDRWRLVLSRLSDGQKALLNCTRPDGLRVCDLKLGRRKFEAHQNHVISELRRQHIG